VASSDNSSKPGKGGLRLIRREQQNEISRTHILDAAEQVFAAKGLNATIKEIAELADFSVGAVYGFFEGKDELLAAVFERHARAFLGAMREAAWESGGSREKLHRLFDVQFEYFRGHPNFYKLFDRLVRSRSWALQFTSAEQSSTWYREALEIMTKLFRDGIASGELIEGDPVVQSAIFSGISTAYISHWIYEVASKGNARIERIAPVAQLHALLDRAFVKRFVTAKRT
jgi:AcrR family transcriptional regulator